MLSVRVIDLERIRIHRDFKQFREEKVTSFAPKLFSSRAQKLTSIFFKENKEVKFTAAIAFCFLPLQNDRK